ncbi:MAG: CDP-diacylglycerol--glycerol-3-phosphate 3-phosphatidyltransferase [Pseudomonadota bacterium]
MVTTLPNLLTFGRIGLIPCFVLFFYLPFDWSAFAAGTIFGVAAITDWLDGYLARRLDQTSPLGAFLDPVADKLMVAVVLIMLLEANPSQLLALPAAVIIGREIAVSALREWMAEIGARGKVAVSSLGKIKTAAQMIALILLIVSPGLPSWSYWLGLAALYLAAALTLWSMLLYLKAAWPELSKAE